MCGPTMCWPLPLEFYLSGHLKILVYSAPIEHEETDIFFKPVEPFKTSLDLWKDVTVHHQKCLCMHWFKWRTFWAFALNCELITSKNSGVIELQICIVSILCSCKYCLVNVLIFDCNLLTRLKFHSLLGIYLYEILLCFCVNHLCGHHRRWQ